MIPHKVYQGLAAGRAVVTGDGAGLREVFEPGTHLAAVPRGDPEALARGPRATDRAIPRAPAARCAPGGARALEIATPEAHRRSPRGGRCRGAAAAHEGRCTSTPAASGAGGRRKCCCSMRGARGARTRSSLLAPAGRCSSARAKRGSSAVRGIRRGDADLSAFARGAARDARGSRPDVVHAHTARAHALGVAAARSAGVRAWSCRAASSPRSGAHPLSRLKYRLGRGDGTCA